MKFIHYQRANKNRGSFLGVKGRWYTANRPLHLVLKLKITGATPPLPLYLQDVDRNLSMSIEFLKGSQEISLDHRIQTGVRHHPVIYPIRVFLYPG